MPLLILSVLIQVAFIIHIVKTGRNTTWIWIVVMLPLAGAIAYLVLEVLPDASNSRTGRTARRKVTSVINPHRDLRSAANRFAVSDSVENSMALAEECLRKGLHEEARELYGKCLTGIHADDPALMFGLARADFALGNYGDVRATLDRLIEHNPDYRNQDAHLLYARTLEAVGADAEALHEYEVLHGYYSGPDASFHFARFLLGRQEPEKARAIFTSILETARRAGSHYQSVHKETLRQVKLALAGR